MHRGRGLRCGAVTASFVCVAGRQPAAEEQCVQLRCTMEVDEGAVPVRQRLGALIGLVL